MNKELWDKTLDNINSKYTDSAAEFLTREGNVDEGHAEEIKPAQKKRFRLGAVGVFAAAAAVFAVAVGVKLAGGNKNEIPTSDGISTALTSTTISTDLSDYTADYSLYEKYFEGVWKNAAEDSAPYFVLNSESVLGSIDSEVLFCEAGGKCAMTYADNGARTLYLRESDSTLYRYDCTDALSMDAPAVTYEYADAAADGASFGTVYYKRLCEQREGFAEVLSATEFERDGALWTRAGTDSAQIRIYSETEEDISLSAQFTNTNGTARYFKLNYQNSPEGWTLENVSDYDILSDTTDLNTLGERHDIDYSIYENVFMGIWESADSGEVKELSYTQTDVAWASIATIYYEDGYWVMCGMSGGAGQFLIIREDEPDVMYSAENYGYTMTLAEYASEPSFAYYRKAIIPAEGAANLCTIHGAQGIGTYPERSLVGYYVVNDYLDGIEGFAEVFDAAHADFTDADGVEWSFDEIPSGYALVGYPDRKMNVLEISEDRIRLGVPFIVKGSFDESIFDTDEGMEEFWEKGLDISQFELCFTKTDGAWEFTSAQKIVESADSVE